MPSRKHFNPGEPVESFTADDYRDIMDRIAARRRLSAVPPLRIINNAPTTIDLALPVGFWATLSGAASPYSFAEKYADTTGTWTTRVRTGTSNAYEVNGVSGLGGKTVWLEPGYPGDYRFQMVTAGGGVTPPTGAWPNGCLCTTAPINLTLTATGSDCAFMGIPSDTFTYRARPAALTGVPNTTAMGYYGDTLLTDPDVGDYYYLLGCIGGAFGLNKAFTNGVFGPNVSPSGVNWTIGVGPNVCTPFYLESYSYLGSPGPFGNCSLVVTG